VEDVRVRLATYVASDRYANGVDGRGRLGTWRRYLVPLFVSKSVINTLYKPPPKYKAGRRLRRYHTRDVGPRYARWELAVPTAGVVLP
jgi:hypothetical protein